MTEEEFQMFGMSADRIEKEYMGSLTAKLSGQEMVVMGILSDAQHLIEFGQGDEARKLLNVAKYVLSEILDSNWSRIMQRAA